MKKETIAALTLALVFAGAVINIGIVGRMSRSLCSDVQRAYEYALTGDSAGAIDTLDKAIGHWLSLDGYTHIFIRHSEINSTTEAFYAFKSDICADDMGSAAGSYALLTETLRSLMTMEQISLGSIF